MVMDSIENKQQAVETKSAAVADPNVSEPPKVVGVPSKNGDLAAQASESKGASNSGETSADTTSVVEAGQEEKKLLISGLFTEGYRLYVAEEYQEASQKLGEATRLSVELYGPFAPQCCQPFLQYGRCLVEIAREEAVILANAKKEEEEESSEEEENGADERKPESVFTGEEDQPSGEPEPDEKSLDNEEPADTTEELAWECLETARKICEKQEQTDEWLEKKATVLVALGDCLGVDDCFDQALKEFHTALDIQKKVYEPHDRRIAETYFHIGRMLVNLGAMNNPEKLEEAASAYDEAAKVLEMKIGVEKQLLSRLAHLESRSSSGDPEQTGRVLEEILNLKKVVDEVIDSAKDARESAVSARAKMEAQRAVMKNAMSTILNAVADSAGGQQSTSTEAGAIDDISGQLRRREPFKRPAVATNASGTEKAGEVGEAEAVNHGAKSEGAKKPRLDDERKKAE